VVREQGNQGSKMQGVAPVKWNPNERLVHKCARADNRIDRIRYGQKLFMVGQGQFLPKEA